MAMFSQRSADVPAAVILILLAGVVGGQWGVTYTAERVCALKGSSVNFSCSYKHPEGLTVTRSFWFSERLRRDGVEPWDVSEYWRYRGRVQYSRTLNYCRMTITDLREKDADTYKFRFYTDDSGGRYSGQPGVTLSVTGLEVSVSDTGGVTKLTCSSTCSLPSSCTYIWYKNLQPVFNQNRDEVYLKDEVVDAGSYSCAVEGYEEHRSPAVCVFEKVLQVKVEGPAVGVSDGQTVTLTCNSTCPLPSSSTYIWYRNQQPVPRCKYASCSVAVVSKAVSYSCAVKNRNLSSPPVYPPKNTRVVILPSGQRVEGESVTLTCSSDANPPVHTYDWFNQRSDAVLGTDQNYTITNISSQQSGLYYCTAHNQLGHSRSGPSRLNVTYPPKNTRVVILPSGQRLEGQSVTLTCSSDANPPVHTYDWFNQRSDAVLGTDQNYTITNISSQQSGLYYCTAHNQLGHSRSGPSHLNVTSLPLDTNTENSSTVYTACGVVVVVVLVVLVLWRRRRSAVSSRASEENRGELSSAPVYENVSSLAMTSDLPEAAVSDDQDDVQYSSVCFSQMKEVPLYSSVRLTDAVREEEEVQYATVNTAKPRAAGNDEPPIYSIVRRT